MKKKTYRSPGFNISLSNDEIIIVRELINDYNVNISAFFREQIKKLYKKIKNENS